MPTSCKLSTEADIYSTHRVFRTYVEGFSQYGLVCLCFTASLTKFGFRLQSLDASRPLHKRSCAIVARIALDAEKSQAESSVVCGLSPQAGVRPIAGAKFNLSRHPPEAQTLPATAPVAAGKADRRSPIEWRSKDVTVAGKHKRL